MSDIMSPASVTLRGPIAEGMQRGLSHVEIVNEALVHTDGAGIEDVINTDAPMVIMQMAFRSDSKFARLDIEAKDALGTGQSASWVPAADAQSFTLLTMNSLNSLVGEGGQFGGFRLDKFDEGAAQFGMSLTSPLYLPTGVLFRVRTGGSTTVHNALFALIGYFA